MRKTRDGCCSLEHSNGLLDYWTIGLANVLRVFYFSIFFLALIMVCSC